MSRQKKKRPPIEDRPSERPRPVPCPPRRHKALLAASLTLLVAWLVLLAVLAVRS